MAAFFAMGVVVEISLGRTKGMLDLLLVLFFAAACYESDAERERQETFTPDALESV